VIMEHSRSRISQETKCSHSIEVFTQYKGLRLRAYCDASAFVKLEEARLCDSREKCNFDFLGVGGQVFLKARHFISSGEGGGALRFYKFRI
jgi:hypothetical protein